MSATGFATRLSTVVLLCAALGVAACGRKSGLDTPYEAAVDARKQAEQEKKEPLPPQPEKPKKERPFILDPLIE